MLSSFCKISNVTSFSELISGTTSSWSATFLYWMLDWVPKLLAGVAPTPVVGINDDNVLNGTGDGYHACLYYFADGQKTGLKIPLAFSVAGMTNPALIRIQSAIYSYQSVVATATDYGLVIGQVMHGFWVIPWKDIDAYRVRLASSARSSGTVSSASGVVGLEGSPGGN